MVGHDERDVFWISVVILTIFSSLGSLYIMKLILKKLRFDINSRLIFHLSMADLGLSVLCLCLCAYNLSHGHLQPENSFVCQFQPIITWYFMEVSILWLTVIAMNSYLILVKNHLLSRTNEIIISVGCWIIPFVSTLLPLNRNTGQRYGHREQLWCTFAKEHKSAQLINLLVYYVPAFIVILGCYINISLMLIKIGRREITGHLNAEKLSAMKKMFFFVLAYFIVWSPLVICYAYEANTGKYVPFWAEYIFDNMLHVQGLLNAILYGSIRVKRKDHSSGSQSKQTSSPVTSKQYSYELSDPNYPNHPSSVISRQSSPDLGEQNQSNSSMKKQGSSDVGESNV